MSPACGSVGPCSRFPSRTPSVTPRRTPDCFPIPSSFARLQRGLVLVTGPPPVPVKSTTHGRPADVASRAHPQRAHRHHRDPIRYLHQHKRYCRQPARSRLPTDFRCLRHVLASGPDIILVGEATRSGDDISRRDRRQRASYLVLAALHTQSAAHRPSTHRPTVDITRRPAAEAANSRAAGQLPTGVCRAASRKGLRPDGGVR